MIFKSYFTVWDGREESRHALSLAAKLTRESDGHLDILCVPATPFDLLYGADLSVDLLQEITTRTREEVEACKRSAEEMMDAENVVAAISCAPAHLSEVARVVGREGRFHDLIVLPRPFGDDGPSIPEEILDGALFGTLAPVLVCPNAPVEEIGRRIMVAWNGDVEAMRAIRAAMPLLREARQVEIVMVEPRPTNDGGAPGFALMAMLTRQGVNAILTPVARSAGRISETLRQKARDMKADLIVMGAYGHSRFRERLLGGVTREMLQASELPVLMTH